MPAAVPTTTLMCRPAPCRVAYDDGEVKQHDLANELFEWLDDAPRDGAPPPRRQRTRVERYAPTFSPASKAPATAAAASSVDRLAATASAARLASEALAASTAKTVRLKLRGHTLATSPPADADADAAPQEGRCSSADEVTVLKPGEHHRAAGHLVGMRNGYCQVQLAAGEVINVRAKELERSPSSGSEEAATSRDDAIETKVQESNGVPAASPPAGDPAAYARVRLLLRGAELAAPSLLPRPSPRLAPSPSLLTAPPCTLKFGDGSFGGFSLAFSPVLRHVDTTETLVAASPPASIHQPSPTSADAEGRLHPLAPDPTPLPDEEPPSAKRCGGATEPPRRVLTPRAPSEALGPRLSLGAPQRVLRVEAADEGLAQMLLDYSNNASRVSSPVGARAGGGSPAALRAGPSPKLPTLEADMMNDDDDDEIEGTDELGL